LKKTSLTNSFIKKKISSISWGKSFLLIICGFAFFNACKDENEVGLDLLPKSDHLSTVFTDTSTVITVTKTEDSLKADELSLQLLGSYGESVFGKSTASVYTQLTLSSIPTFGTNPVADSIVLTLAYSGYYGDTTAQQTLNIYTLTDDMHIDSGYYSNKTFGYNPTAIATASYFPRPNTKDSASNAYLKITLSKQLADSIISQNASVFSANSNWLNYFKGLFIKSEDVSGNGAISYFNFFNSKVTLYFKDSTLVSKSYDFSLQGARLNYFSHDYSGSDVGLQLADSTAGDSLNYLQAMAGVKTKISFPFLKHFLDSGQIVVNRAELKIESSTPIVLPYSLPAKLLLVTTDNTGTSIFPIDYYESSGYFGGDLNSDGITYTFNIGRQLQRYLNGTVNNADFELVISGSGVMANRLIIKSGKNVSSRMKLSFFYTKL
jgi:hypothetical protein